MRSTIAVFFLATAVLVIPTAARAQGGPDRPSLTAALSWLGQAQPKEEKGIPKKYRPAVANALKWIAKQQRPDGHWEAAGGKYPVAMTAMSGLALLMEGSTPRGGKYKDHIRKATEWLLARVQTDEQRDGLIGNPNNQEESYRYMYGHGFGMLFLASVYGEEPDKKKQAQLRDVLTKAVVYSAQAQSSKGGWYYTSKKEGGDKDEGSVTITQVQALRACKNAGIVVPSEAIKKAQDYLKLCTNPTTGAVWYSWISKQDRVAITAAAVACAFNSGEYKDEHGKKWLKYCKQNIPEVGGVLPAANAGHFEYTHYYFAQCVYILGEDRWGDLFGADEKGAVTWKQYRQKLFDGLIAKQNEDGSWPGGGGFSSVGPLYSTVIYATIMQLDNNLLPIYQR